MSDRTYCLVPDCDEQPFPGDELCETHQQEDEAIARRLTRQEQLEGMADRGCDTWEEYRSER